MTFLKGSYNGVFGNETANQNYHEFSGLRFRANTKFPHPLIDTPPDLVPFYMLGPLT